MKATKKITKKNAKAPVKVVAKSSKSVKEVVKTDAPVKAAKVKKEKKATVKIRTGYKFITKNHKLMVIISSNVKEVTYAPIVGGINLDEATISRAAFVAKINDGTYARVTRKIKAIPEPDENTPKDAAKIINGLGNKTSKIIALLACGYKVTEVAKFLDVRYQHVNNVIKYQEVHGNPDGLTGTCAICGKPLTDGLSIKLGIGPICRMDPDNADAIAEMSEVEVEEIEEE